MYSLSGIVPDQFFSSDLFNQMPLVLFSSISSELLILMGFVDLKIFSSRSLKIDTSDLVESLEKDFSRWTESQ